MERPVWHTLADAGEAARAALSAADWDHLMTGAEEEASNRIARAAFERWSFLPRVLRSVPRPALATRLAGVELALPLLVAPVGTHALFHPDAEPATVAGAAAAGALPVISTMSSVAFATAGAGGAPWLIQLYPFEDRGLVREIAHEAIAAGARGAVLTADVPVLGRRVRDRRRGFRSGVDARPYLQQELSRRGLASFWEGWSAEYRWDDVAALAQELPVPLIVKGLLHPTDARLAHEAGAVAVWVSAHGGRQLDHAIAPLDALPAIAAELDGALPVVFDGEVRSGADVAKALALGADAVALGRPAIWGLAAAGGDGVTAVLELVAAQLESVAALVGVGAVGELGREHLHRI
ncbi:alpha-hydroxy acid oxidase [Conexibacter sp. CPCC 206217]|uniref:alpha-hydroxy acid oxidase n=1 Tax=Conexibacter sp. CPCC 206217 TaxID=3064574 RepID=UPI00271BA7CB|nr:alpha-hydroxy acid oxidase [Conexibacter sp. CPCC 206217]MDO8208883.1 alpha-hydroxy acid oxidase [Conexibacter sp. CPCC 206217]